ncbi:MAG: glycoside hydrolase [Anaerolineae bacterium]
MTHPLYIAFVWHMHQPFYRDLRTGAIPLPWVRLHAAKDYRHMAEVMARHPHIHATINMVPALTEQMLAWVEGRAVDDLVRLAEQASWTREEKQHILNLAFSISWDKVIRRYPRYAELLARRPQALADPESFSEADYRDLLAWFNLAWIDPNWLARDPALAALVARGRDFTIADLALIHAKQREIAAGVLPLYRRLADQGQLEISTSPYYHPILPLLIDTDCAQRASPGLPVPVPAFQAPEDAAAQLHLAVEAHVRHFGAPPKGLWPSEGAVSPEILPLVQAAGFTWLATGEKILERSLGRPLVRDYSNLLTEPALLYQPYRVLADTELGPFVIFRDQELSDRIGFLYQHLPGAQAADDLIYRLLEIHRRLGGGQAPFLVSIILDGENCWEHYEHNGDIFLEALYSGLGQHPELKTVTVSEYLTGRRPAATLAKLATGSWIGGDLTTWIGDPEHTRAWNALRRAREHVTRRARSALQQASRPGLARAWQAIYAAEGSDWFWWYCHRNTSDQDALFDRLFRHNLAAAYEALGDEAPAWLAEPINRPPPGPGGRPASGYVTPRLTGAAYPGEAWAAATVIQPAGLSTGTMQRAEAVLEQLFVGHDPHALYLRLDLGRRLDEFQIDIYLSGAGNAPHNQCVRGRHPDPERAPKQLAAAWLLSRQPGQPAPFLYRADGREGWASVGPATAAVAEKALEACLPLATLGLALGDSIRIQVVLIQDGLVVAQLPEQQMASLNLTPFSHATPKSE